MANKKVVIKAVLQKPEAVEELYILGSTKNLGAWNLAKAVKMEKVSDSEYQLSKMLPEGEEVEFKILSAKEWTAVEKGIWNEEIENHKFVVEKGTEISIDVYNFAN